ncbi:hypothetical protein BDR26DRAFT_839678 [Obelidium mucronatum]|nr:hypothetical protein BDR26DRAFT_839678 [Obelidium mucronatum]
MPILIKTEDFTDSSDRLYASVPLNGVKADKADIYANDSYIKINFPPFFYEADLYDKIDPEESEAIVGDGCVKFSMKKVEAKSWSSLRIDGLDVHMIKTRREDAFQRELDRIANQKKQKAIKKREEHYKLIQEQLNVERAEKARVENAKEEEKRIAEESIQQWKQGLSQQAHGQIETIRSDSAIFDASDAITATHICNDDDEMSDDDLDMELIKAKVRKEMERNSKPQPRESGVINFKFTSRGLLPTSTARETEDVKWVHRINQAWEKDAKTRSDALYDPVSPDEKNPIFLKEKGNAFFKAGNLHSAVNAFTASLDLDPTLIACVTNRAVCHLKLENYQECINDCSRAMEMISSEQERKMERDPVAGMDALPVYNAAKLKLHVRRAAAYTKAEKLTDAVKDYQCAVVLDPKNELVKTDLINIQNLLLRQK